MIDKLILPLADDFHIHLRQDELMKLVVPRVRLGGAGRVLVMPNLQPPIYTVDQAISYRKELQSIDPSIDFLMTLYLHTGLRVEDIELASKNGIKGIKYYPHGVTTNSNSGLTLNIRVFYPIFSAMQDLGMVLNLHGEAPSDPVQNICVMNAEENFLHVLETLHNDFPRLHIVLEHVTTEKAVDKICSLGPTVVATITLHHLDLTIDDVVGKCHGYCKPVAKYPTDREALRKVVREGNPKFFLGSDSAPHPRHLKETSNACAGIFSSAHLYPYLATIFEKLGCLEKLENFATKFGCQFYNLVPQERHLTLIRNPTRVENAISYVVNDKTFELIPYMAGQELLWKILQ